MEHKLNVLKKIAKELNENHITWALGASMLLYFKGVVEEFHDIDLMILNEETTDVKRILDSLGIRQPDNPNGKYKTKTFMEYVIDGVDIDVMAGFAICCEEKVIDCSLNKNQIVDEVFLEGERIPLQSLELWLRYYELMERNDKVKIIKEYLGEDV
jgi:hypothetical protein